MTERKTALHLYITFTASHHILHLHHASPIHPQTHLPPCLAPETRCFYGAIALLQPLFRCSSFRGNGSPSSRAGRVPISPMSRVVALLPSPPVGRGGLFRPKPIAAVWLSDILVLYSPPLLEVRMEVAPPGRLLQSITPWSPPPNGSSFSADGGESALSLPANRSCPFQLAPAEEASPAEEAALAKCWDQTRPNHCQ